MKVRPLCIALSACLAALAGCDRLDTPSAAPVAAPSHKSFDDEYGSGQYPDSTSWVNAGNSTTATITILAITGSFNTSFAWFTASGWLQASNVNVVSQTVTARLLGSNGTPINSGTASAGINQFLPINYDSVLTDSIVTNSHTCGLIGKSQITGYANLRLLNPAFNSETVSSNPFDKPGADKTEPTCPAPRPRPMLSYASESGSDLVLTIPINASVNVSFDGSASVPGQDGGPAITGYAWTLDGVASGSSVSGDFAGVSWSRSVGLTVTDEFGGTAFATGSITINNYSPCGTDDGSCDQGESAAFDGSGSIPASWEPSAPQGSAEEVCYFTVWYQYNYDYGYWYYTNTTLDGCDWE